MDIFDQEQANSRSYEQICAYQKYKAHRYFYSISNKLCNIVRTIGTREQYESLNSFLAEVNNTRIGSIHQYTICPACYHALYKRKPTSRFKRFVNYKCSLCNTSARKPGNLLIRNQLTLDEAKAKIQTEHPEIFL